ncbi:glycosyltransferase [Pseudomonadota bacterium]|nr:glycosyltransferase [Pseudomonadota bacterium]
MKKIIHFHPNGNYAEKFVKPLKDYEIKSGFHSLLVTEIKSNKNDINMPFTLFCSPWKILFRIVNLIKFLHIKKPYIVISHNSITSFLPLLTSRLCFVRNIIYFNHGVPFIGYSGFLYFILKFVEFINCSLAKNIYTVSFDMKYELSKITNKKITVVNFGSACGLKDRIKFRDKEIQNIKESINFSSQDLLFLYVGRPNIRKGFVDVINLWNKKLGSEEKYKLILLGITKNDLLKWFKDFPKNTYPMGFVNEAECYFSLTNYLLMTSHHEGLSYTILEALQYDTIVISNDILGAREIIEHKNNGFLVRDNNFEDIYEIIKLCESDLYLKKKIIDEGKKVILKYNITDFEKNYINCLNNLN